MNEREAQIQKIAKFQQDMEKWGRLFAILYRGGMQELGTDEVGDLKTYCTHDEILQDFYVAFEAEMRSKGTFGNEVGPGA